MKLIRGDAGKPDGWTPPQLVTDISENDQLNLQHIFDQDQSVKRIKQVQLYDLLTDPTEEHNVADQHPDLVDTMLRRLFDLESTMIPPNIAPEEEKGNPIHFNRVFSPGWCASKPEMAVNDNDIFVEVIN